MAELQKVDDWLSALLANLEPAARSRMMRQLAQETAPDTTAEYQNAAQP
ncbi:phage virion morphogenesis protein [Escherichia coli]|uniref:Phage virion morphogenesis protein n=1 Tax=Escherichia coli TaxID=562 RepID=A0A377K9A5_ECOLX|nr:phage virion morphogenesis protein [Escherichia coli]